MNKPRVLVVDDEMSSLTSIYIGLLLRNFEMEATKCSQEMFQRIQRFRPQVILINSSMPGIDPHELCRVTQEHNAALLMMVDNDSDVPHTLAGCPVQKVPKPVNIEQLFQLITALVSKQ